MTAHIPNRSIPPRRHFVRAACAAAQGYVNKTDPAKYLTGADSEVALRIMQRADVDPATTTGTGWADEIASEAFRDFLIDLSPYSGAARLIAKAVPASIDALTVANYPVRPAGASASSWVAEGGAIPVRSPTMDRVAIGPARKLAGLLVWSSELSKRSDARIIFEQMLREDVAAGIDGAFFATTAGSASAHAGLLYGVSPLAGYAGGDDEAMKTDLVALSNAVTAGGSGDVTFIVDPKRLAKLRIIAPEMTAGLDIAASTAVPVDRIIAADAAALLVSVDTAPEIDVSKNATFHMSDTPLDLVSGVPVVADPARSAFQTDTAAVRIIQRLAFAKRRSTAVSYLDGATW